VLVKKLWNTKEYQRLTELGLIPENDRTELIDGEIILMSPKGLAHVICCQNLIRELSKILQEGYILDCQNPIILGNRDEPEPDFIILKPSYSKKSLPIPSDLELVIEVSDTTLKYDRETKLRKYAAAGIPQYWIVNLVDEVVEIYTEPLIDLGFYSRSKIIPKTEIIDDLHICFRERLDFNKIFPEP
jgi:Uma2 family endonuclease